MGDIQQDSTPYSIEMGRAGKLGMSSKRMLCRVNGMDTFVWKQYDGHVGF